MELLCQLRCQNSCGTPWLGNSRFPTFPEALKLFPLLALWFACLVPPCIRQQRAAMFNTLMLDVIGQKRRRLRPARCDTHRPRWCALPFMFWRGITAPAYYAIDRVWLSVLRKVYRCDAVLTQISVTPSRFTISVAIARESLPTGSTTTAALWWQKGQNRTSIRQTCA